MQLCRIERLALPTSLEGVQRPLSEIPTLIWGVFLAMMELLCSPPGIARSLSISRKLIVERSQR